MIKSDIQIAQEAKMLPIMEVAKKAGIPEESVELYGNYKAKLTHELFETVKDKKNGKLVQVLQ